MICPKQIHVETIDCFQMVNRLKCIKIHIGPQITNSPDKMASGQSGFTKGSQVESLKDFQKLFYNKGSTFKNASLDEMARTVVT